MSAFDPLRTLAAGMIEELELEQGTRAMTDPGISQGPLARILAAVSLPLLAGLSQAGSAAQTPASAPLPPAVEAAARDFPALRGLCAPRPATPGPRGGASPTDLVPLGPTRVFDNLYYVGSRSLSAWAISTSKGIILIDALRNADEARSVIEPSMRRLGLDPAQIRYIVVTHGHGDHYGGVRYLVERYRPRVVMSEIDWGEVAKPVLQLDAPHWGRPPERDIAVRDGHRLRLGDTTIELPVARTHTPGTISPIFTVRDGRRRHKVLLWGGTGFNFGPSVERLGSYGASADRLQALARRRKVDVLISNHPNSDASIERMEAMRERQPRAAHPFVIGRSRVSAVLGALGTCARFQAQAINQSDASNR